MKKILLSYGGGKDSTALIAIDQQRDKACEWLGITREALDTALPVFDYAIFADPGAEFAVTYRTIAKVAAMLGDRFVQVRREKESIAEWCLRLGIVPVMPGGSHICSKKFKGDVMADWAKAQGITEATWLIGIEADEGYRVKRFTAPKAEGVEYRYPLVELGLSRDELDKLLWHLGWSEIHKSSCVFCPFMQEDEIADIFLNHPDEWALVKDVEAAFREASAVKHAAWKAAGQPLNKGGRAPKGMWRQDSWAEGTRLFAKAIGGKRLSVQEWEDRIRAQANKTPASSRVPLVVIEG